MKVLATAFCCKPNSGSESAFGWWWTTNTAQDHDVVVVTVESQREVIEAELEHRDDLGRLSFEYVKGPAAVSASGSTNRFERIHQYLWQLRAIPTVRRLARSFDPDVLQHVSTGTWRQPLALASVNRPLVTGPLAGSERLPRGFASTFGLRAWLWETGRSMLMRAARIDPLVRLSLRRTDVIIASGGVTRAEMGERYPDKTITGTRAFRHPAIDPSKLTPTCYKLGEPLRLCWVGRLVSTKGLDILLKALTDPRLTDCTLDVLGGGDIDGYRQIAIDLGVADRVSFHGHVGRDELFDTVRSSHLYVFTSLQELMGQSLSEAMQLGAACLVFDWSGAAALVGDSGAMKVPVGKPRAAATDLATALSTIRSTTGVGDLQRRAIERIGDLTDPVLVRERRADAFQRAIDAHRGKPARTTR